jgi:uncharacterized GH25 family protein
MITRRLSLAFVASLAFAADVCAHDFWIEPSKYRPAVGERIDIDLRVGEKWVGEAVERNPLRIVRFGAIDALGHEEPIVGIDRRAPAGLWRARTAGLFLLCYESNPTALELEAVKFEHYLGAEGLEHVLEARRERGESSKKGLEIYSRSVKTLVFATETGKPEPSSDGWNRRLGITLEIVPEKDPALLKIGDELTLRVFFKDQPLAGALVGFMPKSAPESDVRMRSDADGRVTFKVTTAGAQQARVCWMVAAPKDSGADWQSTWSSLTFEVRTPAPSSK